MSNKQQKTSTTNFELRHFYPFRITQLSEKICLNLLSVYSQRFKLSIPEWKILGNLAEIKEVRAKDIAKLTNMEKSKVSRAIKSLSERGLVIQQKSEVDARIKSLCLTTKGLKLYQEVIPEMARWEETFLRALSLQDRKNLDSILEKLSVSLD